MLSTLITSKSRVEMITWFVTHAGERFHYNELVRILKASPPSIQRELKRLEKAGFLKSVKEANVRFYWVNQDFSLYPELKNMVLKTTGLADFLRQELPVFEGVQAAFIYGSVAKNREDAKSDIDLMVIGEVDEKELHGALSKAEKKLAREVNFSLFSPTEWKRRVKSKDSFISDVLSNPKIFLIGDEDVL